MDSVTQGLLGAAIAQAGFEGRLGRRALGWGAAAGLLPDLDVVAVATHGPFGELLYHRGFTHSLWFGPVVGVLFGELVWRYFARRAPPRGDPDPGAPAARGDWMALFVLVLFTHPLLDLFTAYGTQLLAPFSRQRFALNGVGIIDPLYSALLAGALAARLFVAAGTARRLAAAALALSTLYLGYGVHLNEQARTALEARFARDGEPAHVRVYPTILQPWLRRFVARTRDEVHVGLWTPLRPEVPVWGTFRPQEHPLIERALRTREGRIFSWFAMDEISARVIRARDRTVVEIDDLRYGTPGPPDQGLWGVRAVYDSRGRPLGPVRRYYRDAAARADLGGLWRAMWGEW